MKGCIFTAFLLYIIIDNTNKIMERLELNIIKDNIMSGCRYCQKIYNNGLTSVSQFNTFKNLCQNYVDYCNFWCNKLQPKLGWLMYNRMKQYNELYALCELGVKSLSTMISEFQAMLDKQAEEDEAMSMIETRARVEHAIAMELRNSQIKVVKQHPIGYCINRSENNEINDDYQC